MVSDREPEETPVTVTSSPDWGTVPRDQLLATSQARVPVELTREFVPKILAP